MYSVIKDLLDPQDTELVSQIYSVTADIPARDKYDLYHPGFLQSRMQKAEEFDVLTRPRLEGVCHRLLESMKERKQAKQNEAS